MGTGLIALFLGSTARAEDLFTEGPDDLGLGNGISVADMDGDGWVDIVVPSAMSLWTNQAGEGWVYSDIPLRLHGGAVRRLARRLRRRWPARSRD
jgi:hypothetical protein